VSGFDILKHLHMLCAFLSVSGFALRGYWMMTDNPLLQRRPVKILPHIVDTLLLGSAIGMLLIWQVSPGQLPWVVTKIAALLLYIGLGLVALRFGKSRQVKVAAWLLALLVAAYIWSVAYTKSPLGLLAVI
jgi:uncharacterized membrane protein SirB2